MCFDVVVALLCGRLIFISLGDDMVDEITKNISNRKMMSVIDDIENEASILLLLLRAII